MKKILWAAAFVAACTLLVMVPSTSIAQFAFDVNDRGNSTLTQSGFDVFMIDDEGSTPVTRTFGTNDVTLYMVGSDIYKDRARTYPLNGGAFTESDILRDFVYANDANGGGLNVKVEGLTPYGVYSGSIWSADGVSNGPRISDWIANGTVVANNYVFDGDDFSDIVPPPSNDTYRIDFTATAAADGTLMIQGRHEKRSVGVSVMFNALQLTQTGMAPVGTPIVRADFGSGSAMSGFTQVNLASASSGATVGGKTITVSPVGQYSEVVGATSYEVSINFWSDSANDWAIQAGLTETGMTIHDVSNSTSTGITASNRTLYTASLGTLTPAQLDKVYWDDTDASSSYERTWFDSISLRRTDDDAVFYIWPSDDNTVGVDNPENPWWTTSSSESGGMWRLRGGYGETLDGIYQATNSLGNHLQVATTIDDPAPGIPTTAVTLLEADTGTVAGGVDFTESGLLSDYIVASNGDVDTSGLDVLVEDLAPGQDYIVKLWAFDDAASESTRSTWTANGTLVNDGYRFDPDQDPMTNHEYSFSFMVTADENGEILIEGRVGIDRAEGVDTPNVYLNAMEIVEVPEPGSIVCLLGMLLGVLFVRRR